jgi:hypothetical protein
LSDVWWSTREGEVAVTASKGGQAAKLSRTLNGRGSDLYLAVPCQLLTRSKPLSTCAAQNDLSQNKHGQEMIQSS